MRSATTLLSMVIRAAICATVSCIPMTLYAGGFWKLATNEFWTGAGTCQSQYPDWAGQGSTRIKMLDSSTNYFHLQEYDSSYTDRKVTYKLSWSGPPDFLSPGELVPLSLKIEVEQAVYVGNYFALGANAFGGSTTVRTNNGDFNFKAGDVASAQNTQDRAPSDVGRTMSASDTYQISISTTPNSACTIGRRYTYNWNPVPTGVPVCTLTASPAVVAVGSSSTLTASCSPAATSYVWSGSGLATNASSGKVLPTEPTRYSVVGTNSLGSGNPSSAVVYVCNQSPSINYAGVDLTGTSGNDQIRSGISADTIDGGSGIDTVIYNCNKNAFTITKTTSGWAVSSNAEGSDMLVNIERIQFGDQTLALDITGNAGQAYRIYQAALNRVPDSGGLKFWIGAMDSGVSLKDVAAGFMNSQEFKSLYGASPTNEDFVTKLYTNILHRSPDPGGYAYWVNALNNKIITQVEAIVFLSESSENQAGVLNAIINGIGY